MKWPWEESRFELEVKLALGQINQRLVDLTKVVEKITIKVNEMAQALQNLQAQNEALITNVTNIRTVQESVVAAITGLTTTQAELIVKLNDAIKVGDPVALQDVADIMAEQNQIIVDTAQKLADAVATIPAVPPVA